MDYHDISYYADSTFAFKVAKAAASDALFQCGKQIRETENLLCKFLTFCCNPGLIALPYYLRKQATIFRHTKGRGVFSDNLLQWRNYYNTINTTV